MDKILLVDDVKLLREIQKGFLATSPVHVLTAGDGIEALAVARKELPNLIVMDNHMPNMDGVTCCREIKADPFIRHIPVIMLTNAVKPSDFDEYKAAGAADWMSKPIDGRLFLATLKKHLPAIECRGARVPLNAEVRVICHEVVHVGTAKDISLKGILIASAYQPTPGDEIRFDFVLPGSGAPTEVRGKVAWVRKCTDEGKAGSKTEFGVEVIEITGKGIPFIRKSELEAYVALHTPVA